MTKPITHELLPTVARVDANTGLVHQIVYNVVSSVEDGDVITEEDLTVDLKMPKHPEKAIPFDKLVPDTYRRWIVENGGGEVLKKHYEQLRGVVKPEPKPEPEPGPEPVEPDMQDVAIA